MARAISVHAPVHYVLEGDLELPEDDPQRTVFLLKPLSGVERHRLEAIESQSERCFEALKIGLRGWKSFIGEDGAPVAFSRDDDVAADAQPYLQHLAVEYISELYAFVLMRSRLSRADRGKSPTPSDSPAASSTSSVEPAPEATPTPADAGAAPTP